MPLGWYLAQGLYPLAPSDSDDEEGACELPDGRIVCGPHGLVVCGKCCTDYSFMDDNSSDLEEQDEGDESDSSADHPESEQDFDIEELPFEKKRRGTGQVFPTKFTPPTPFSIPTQLFPGRRTYMQWTRYIDRNDPRSVLILTDGACLNNGQPNPKAGWAFVHGPGLTGQPAVASGRLESKGPFGDESIQSSNRAELRAVIAALRSRAWEGEGFNTVTFATDSEYVVEGATSWARRWITNGWKTSMGADVKNKDLWEMLLGEVEKANEERLSVRFWKIPREYNIVADVAAKAAASEGNVPDRWVETVGIAI
ncbi:ribonuclease H-like protein [Hypoxylon trugodes]|uniref:ribonuclease H-like protein n=1 Tax=Hypoxylon trugodes TaxID=326681 RepID=UPI0021928205|nr:ribonuclease H-like protein [Hypoxylon trugodes]KAI1384829.1 ribonuclease H-like protein [Hypoxylon trugodes]